MQNEWVYALDTEADTRARFHAVAEQIKQELAANNDVPVLPASLLSDDRYDIPPIADARRREIAEVVEEHVREMEKVLPLYRGVTRDERTGEITGRVGTPVAA